MYRKGRQAIMGPFSTSFSRALNFCHAAPVDTISGDHESAGIMSRSCVYVWYCMPFVAKFKQKNSMFKKLIQCSKISFNVQRFHSMFKNFIQSSKISFNVQYFHSKFKKFIQSSKSSFKVQNVHSKFKKRIQSSKTSIQFTSTKT